VLGGDAVDGGESFGEGDHLVELGLVADLSVFGVIAELFAVAVVSSCCLEVAVGIGADPDVFPGGGDDEGFDSDEGFVVVDGFIVCVNVREAFAVMHATDAGGVVGDVVEAGVFGAGDGIGGGGFGGHVDGAKRAKVVPITRANKEWAFLPSSPGTPGEDRGEGHCLPKQKPFVLRRRPSPCPLPEYRERV